MDHKTCTRCKKEKPVSEFYVVYISPKNGKPIYKSECKTCCKERASKSMAVNNDIKPEPSKNKKPYVPIRDHIDKFVLEKFICF